MHTFDTLRLHLRPLDARDEALYCHLYIDPDLMRHIALPLEKEKAQRSFGAACRQQLPRPQRWIISERATGSDIGLFALIGKDQEAEIGVMLLPAWQGLGLATEALGGGIDWGFAAGGLTLITACQAVADNPPVIRMLEKYGFRRMPSQSRGQMGQDWELTRDEWHSRHPALVAGADANR